MTADRHDQLYKYDQMYSRLLEVLSALPVMESRRGDIEDVAEYLCSTLWSATDYFIPITKQDEHDLLVLWKRVNALRLHSAG